MKKVLALVLTVVMAAALAVSCSGSTSAVDAVKKKGKLVMLTESGFAPYEYMGADGKVAGIDVDIATKIAEKLGVQVEVVDMAFDGLIPALQGGKGDIILAGMTMTEERKGGVDFSTPYADSTQMIIVPAQGSTVASESDLAGKTVGVQLGTTGDLYMTENFPDTTVKQFKSGIEAASDLKNGKLDAVILDLLPASNIVAQNSDLTLVEMSAPGEQFAAAVKKGDEAFLKIVNEVIEGLIADGSIDTWTAEHIATTTV